MSSQPGPGNQPQTRPDIERPTRGAEGVLSNADPFAQFSAGELLAESEHRARQLLERSSAQAAATLVAGWPDLLRAAAEVWTPTPRINTSAIQPIPLARNDRVGSASWSTSYWWRRPPWAARSYRR